MSSDVHALLLAQFLLFRKSLPSPFDRVVKSPVVTNTDPFRRSDQYSLEQISVPTLIINARDDPAANYADALAMRERIPDVTFVSIEEGGHLMLGSGERVKNEMRTFLQEKTLTDPQSATSGRQ